MIMLNIAVLCTQKKQNKENGTEIIKIEDQKCY